MHHKKELFRLDPDTTYLNCAYMSPLLRSVEEAGIDGIKRKRDPLSISPDTFFGESEELRKEIARLTNCSEPSRFAIIPSVSYGMANVARNLTLKPGDRILVADEQFPSNVYPWRRVAQDSGADIEYLKVPAGPDRGKRLNQKIHDAIDDQTAMVALAHVHWADGTRYDLKSIRKKTRQHDALLVIDGTQSVGALPFDIDEIRPDALVCAGYKWLMGPYSIGLAYYGPAFDKGIPIEENWINRHNSEDFSGLVNYEDAYQPGALRYEVGEHSNFILVPMMLQALRELNSWGIESIQDHCRQISAKAVQKLSNAGFMIEDEAFRAHHIMGLRLGEHHDMQQITRKLQEAQISVSIRGDSIRVSPNVYNTEEDMLKLAETITQ